MACEAIRCNCRWTQDNHVDDPGCRNHSFGNAIDQLGAAFRNQRRFVVEIWRDRIFGTFAFRQEPVANSPRIQGVAKDSNGKPLPNQRIKLTIGGKAYSTMSDQTGHFAFFARNIPAGSASLLVANQPAQTVSIAAL